MARSWAELLGDAEGPEETAEQQHGLLRAPARLARQEPPRADRRARRRDLRPGNDEDWERLEEALIPGDVGVPRDRRARAAARGARRARRPRTPRSPRRSRSCSASRARSNLPAQPERDPRRRRQRHRQDDDDRQARAEAARARPHGPRSAPPTRSAPRPRSSSRSGPTAREADFVGARAGRDPAAVAYDAIEAAPRARQDVVIVDTAGRLHTQTNLMEELAKVRRVIDEPARGRAARDAARRRRDDRPERPPAGAALRRGGRRDRRRADEARRLGEGRDRGRDRLRARPAGEAVGVGEGLDDLRPFDPQDFARALVAG